MIRNIEEAKAALRDILGLRDGKQQVVQITKAISLSIDQEARKFLTAARERILKLQSRHKKEETQETVPPSPEQAPPPTSAPVPPPPPAPPKRIETSKAPRPRARPKDFTIRKTRRVGTRRMTKTSRTPAPGAPAGGEIETRKFEAMGPKEDSKESQAPSGKAPVFTKRQFRAKRKTEALDASDFGTGDKEDIPLLPEDRILDEEFILMFESLEKFAQEGISVKSGPPPGTEPAPAPKRPAPKPAQPEPKGAEESPPELTRHKTRPAPERIQDAPVTGTAAFAEIREEIQQAGTDQRDQTKEFRKSPEGKTKSIESIVSEIEEATAEGNRYTGTRAFIRGNKDGNVVFFDAWELHSDGIPGAEEGETPVVDAPPPQKAPSPSPPEEKPLPPPAPEPPPPEPPPPAPREESPPPKEKKPPKAQAPAKPPKKKKKEKEKDADLSSEVLLGLRKKIEEKRSAPPPADAEPMSAESTKPPAPLDEAGGLDEASTVIKPAAGAESVPVPAAPGEFPFRLPDEVILCIDRCVEILDRTNRSFLRPLLATAAGDDFEKVWSLAEQARSADEEGNSRRFREAADELYSGQMRWKIRYSRRLSRVERYLRTLMAGSHLKDIASDITRREKELIIDTIFYSDAGVVKFSAFTVGGATEDREAAEAVRTLLALYRGESP
jgi:hypothetical protein